MALIVSRMFGAELFNLIDFLFLREQECSLRYAEIVHHKTLSGSYERRRSSNLDLTADQRAASALLESLRAKLDSFYRMLVWRANHAFQLCRSGTD